MPLGPVSMSLWGLPLTQAPRQPDPPPPGQASGAADAPAWGKAPDPDQPAPQRVQPGQGPQGQQPETQGQPGDSSGQAAQFSAQEQAARLEAQAGLAAGTAREKTRAAQRDNPRQPEAGTRRDRPAEPPPIAARLNPLSRWA
jgi:hypothetical protein